MIEVIRCSMTACAIVVADGREVAHFGSSPESFDLAAEYAAMRRRKERPSSPRPARPLRDTNGGQFRNREEKHGNG